MGRLLDQDALFEAFKDDGLLGRAPLIGVVKAAIAATPTAKTTRVLHCCSCRYYMPKCEVCGLHGGRVQMGPLDHCSKAKPKMDFQSYSVFKDKE